MQFSQDSLITLFERFYRYGYLVFGGGQVVVPVMQGELVDQTGLLTSKNFSPVSVWFRLFRPMFSFAAFAGGLSENHGEITRQILGALIGGLAISSLELYFFFVFILYGRNFESLPGFPKLFLV